MNRRERGRSGAIRAERPPVVTHEGPAPRVSLPATPQRVWGGLAVVNFTCGAAGTGAVVAILAAALVAPVSEPAMRAIQVVGLILAGAGFAAVGAEAGRPLRGINAFRHLRRSWMSREALAAAAFGVAVALDVVRPGPWQRGLGAVAALAFMLSQGFILLAARGVPAWATWEIPILFITSGLTKGFGIVLVVLAALGGAEALREAAALAVGALLVDLLAWFGYSGSREGPPAKQEGLARLRAGWVGAGIVGLGHLLPLAALVVILWAGGPEAGTPGRMIAALAGLCMVAGGAVLKWAVVMQAGFLQPLGLSVLRSIGWDVGARPSPALAGPGSRSAVGSSRT